MTTKCQFVASASVFVALAMVLTAQTGNSVKFVPKAVRNMDYKVLPSDAPFHFRTKWSNDWLIGIDDDLGTPSFWIFDRSGKSIFNTSIQIPMADKIRFDDFAAAPDGTVWAAGHAISVSGQHSYFLARISSQDQSAQIIQTTPYRPCQLAVASDGSLWTIGYEEIRDANGGTNKMDQNKDVLRHFESNGKLIGSAVPLDTIGSVRAVVGFLAATKDRIGWYSPYNNRPGEYVEFSPDFKVLNSYPLISVPQNVSYIVDGFVLTPAGKVFARASSAVGKGLPPTLFELDRTAKAWIPVSLPHNNSKYIPMLQGNDGEALVFSGPPDRSKMQVFDIAQGN